MLTFDGVSPGNSESVLFAQFFKREPGCAPLACTLGTGGFCFKVLCGDLDSEEHGEDFFATSRNLTVLGNSEQKSIDLLVICSFL